MKIKLSQYGSTLHDVDYVKTKITESAVIHFPKVGPDTTFCLKIQIDNLIKSTQK